MSEYVPRLALIEDISREQYAVVTFTADHTFVLNEIISFRVSQDYGMKEINEKHAKVLGLTSDTVTVDIDSTNYTPFVVPGVLRGTTPPCAVPSTSGVNLNLVVPEMILNDCFDNRP
jgi:hypothetical protein